jgi:AraC-like DNA-binding protein
VTGAGATADDHRPAEVLRSPGLDNFRLSRRAVGPGLADIVDYHWIVEWRIPPGQEHIQQVVTHPSVHLTAEPDRAVVTGVVTCRFQRRLAGSGRVVGVRFRPAGFAALWPERMAGLTDREAPAASVLGRAAGEALTEIRGTADVDTAVRRMEALLEQIRGPRPRGAELVDDGVDHIVGNPEVTRSFQVAAHLGVSPRTLQRRFDRYLGVGPKWVIQRRRIHDVLEEIERGRIVNWSVLAARLGFTDQAHFVKAFTEIVGRPPSRYELT